MPRTLFPVRGYIDQQKIPDRKFNLNVILYALLLVRFIWYWVHIKITLHAKNCKLLLVHMPTEYFIMIIQISDIFMPFSLILTKTSCFWVHTSSALFHYESIFNILPQSFVCQSSYSSTSAYFGHIHVLLLLTVYKYFLNLWMLMWCQTLMLVLSFWNFFESSNNLHDMGFDETWDCLQMYFEQRMNKKTVGVSLVGQCKYSNNVLIKQNNCCTLMIRSIRTDKSRKAVPTQIKPILDQVLRCLPFHWSASFGQFVW